MRVFVGILGLVLLAGCAARPPVVSDISHDSAKIQIPSLLFQSAKQQQQSQVQAEADRACGIYGRIASNPISSRCVQHGDFGICLTEEVLFACAPADGED